MPLFRPLLLLLTAAAAHSMMVGGQLLALALQS
jgi:hypothetical protein